MNKYVINIDVYLLYRPIYYAFLFTEILALRWYYVKSQTYFPCFVLNINHTK
jgi:hypothetical protein